MVGSQDMLKAASCRQVMAWLQIKVKRTMAALQASGGAFQVMDNQALMAYATGVGAVTA